VESHYCLYDLAFALLGQGDSFDAGCKEGNTQNMLSKAEVLRPGKIRRAVRNWQWWDLKLPKNKKLPRGVLPSIVFANNIIADSSGKYLKRSWIRSSALVEFHEKCIFETKNTFYVLVGEGVRKAVEYRAVVSGL